MSDSDLVLPPSFAEADPEPPKELFITGEAEAYSIQNNVYYRLETKGRPYEHIWHNGRRFKVEQIVQAQEDKGTDIYLYGISDDPYPIERYECGVQCRSGEIYCRPFDRKVAMVNVAPDLIGKPWNEEALAYLECVGPKFLSVFRPHLGGILIAHQWQLGEVQVTVDENDNIVSVVKKTNIGVFEE